MVQATGISMTAMTTVTWKAMETEPTVLPTILICLREFYIENWSLKELHRSEKRSTRRMRPGAVCSVDIAFSI